MQDGWGLVGDARSLINHSTDLAGHTDLIFTVLSRVVEFLGCTQRCGREGHWFVQDLVVDPIDNHLQPLFTPTGKRFWGQAAAAALWQAIKKTLAGEQRVWVMAKSTFRHK